MRRGCCPTLTGLFRKVLCSMAFLAVLAADSFNLAFGKVDRRTGEFVIGRGAYPVGINYYGFPRGLCASPNEVALHGVPNTRPLEEGEGSFGFVSPRLLCQKMCCTFQETSSTLMWQSTWMEPSGIVPPWFAWGTLTRMPNFWSMPQSSAWMKQWSWLVQDKSRTRWVHPAVVQMFIKTYQVVTHQLVFIRWFAVWFLMLHTAVCCLRIEGPSLWAKDYRLWLTPPYSAYCRTEVESNRSVLLRVCKEAGPACYSPEDLWVAMQKWTPTASQGIATVIQCRYMIVHDI